MPAQLNTGPDRLRTVPKSKESTRGYLRAQPITSPHSADAFAFTDALTHGMAPPQLLTGEARPHLPLNLGCAIAWNLLFELHRRQL